MDMVNEFGVTCPWDEESEGSATKMTEMCSKLIYIWQPGAFVMNLPQKTGILLEVIVLKVIIRINFSLESIYTRCVLRKTFELG